MRINTFAKLISVLTLQKQNLATYAAAVGATAADITEVTNSLNNLLAIDAFVTVIDANKQGAYELKELIWRGDPLSVIPPLPPAPSFPAFVGTVAGVLQRTNARNMRFRAAPGYTSAIGIALGIAGGIGERPNPNEVTPEIIVSAKQSNYAFTVKVKNREQADMWEVRVHPDGGQKSFVAGFATGKAGEFTYTPANDEAGRPVQLSVYVQLKRKNKNYGQPSAQKRATVNP